MILKLPYNELRLVGLCLTMYKYVPYNGMAKPELYRDNKEVFNTVDRKILAVVEAGRDKPQSQRVEIELACPEISLLVRVVQADMEQCDKGDAKCSLTEYHVNFGTERKDIEGVLTKLLSYEAHCE